MRGAAHQSTTSPNVVAIASDGERAMKQANTATARRRIQGGAIGDTFMMQPSRVIQKRPSYPEASTDRGDSSREAITLHTRRSSKARRVLVSSVSVGLQR